MLALPQQIQEAMSLTAQGVRAALHRSGYYDEVKSARFLGMNTTGSFVYEISYQAETIDDITNGETQNGKVYVSFASQGANRPLMIVADY